MNHRQYKSSLLFLLFGLLGCSTASAILSQSDKQLNQNIKSFTPIYTNTQTISWEYWGKKYEFVLSLSDDEKTSPTPPSELSKEFLGYKNRNTKLNILCNKLDPSFNRLLSSKLVDTFNIDDFSKTFVYIIDDLGPQKKIEITISAARDMHDIEVVESRTALKIFKTYKPTRIFNLSFNIKDASERDTISAFTKDSICYNLK